MEESDSAMFGAQQYFLSKGKPEGRGTCDRRLNSQFAC